MPIAHLEKGALKLLGMIHKWGLRHQPPLAGAPASERGSQSEDSDSVAAADIGGLAAWELERVPIRPKRRLPYDILVPEAEYRTCYNRLKETYGKPWADNWPEKTDSQKFVFEEVGIAAYLCPRPPGAFKRPYRSLAFPYENPFCMALLYGRAGRLTTLFGGFRPGQCACGELNATPTLRGGDASMVASGYRASPTWAVGTGF
jgi:hypothetical protein